MFRRCYNCTVEHLVLTASKFGDCKILTNWQTLIFKLVVSQFIVL